MTLNDAIRKALAGSSSQQPVNTKTLARLGKPDAVALALESMLATREINTAKVFKEGAWSVQCWLTGAIGITPAFTIRPPSFPAIPARQPAPVPAHATTQPKQPKEKVMSTPTKRIGAAPGELNTTIYNKIVEHPGIIRAALIRYIQQQHPSAPEKQIVKTIANLVHASKKVRTEGPRGEFAYFLNDGTKPKPVAKPAPDKPAKPSKPATCPKKQVVVEKPVGAGHAREQKASRARPAPTNEGAEFSIMLSESGNLHVSTGVVTVVLTEQQAARLHRFIGRIHLEGLPA